MRPPTSPFIPSLLLLVSALAISTAQAASDSGGGGGLSGSGSGSGIKTQTSSNIEAEFRGLEPSCQNELKKLMTSSSTIGSCTAIGVRPISPLVCT